MGFEHGKTPKKKADARLVTGKVVEDEDPTEKVKVREHKAVSLSVHPVTLPSHSSSLEEVVKAQTQQIKQLMAMVADLQERVSKLEKK